MKAAVETETTYKLVLSLTEEEAMELLGYVQNYHGEEGQESSTLSNVRAHMYEALYKSINI